jgi:hypothetical protein
MNKEFVVYLLSRLSEADDFISKALPKVEDVGADFDLKFARNRIRSARGIIIDHAVEAVAVETVPHLKEVK